MRELNGTSVTDAIKSAIQKWIPGVNIFSEMGGESAAGGIFLDPNDSGIYPYIFIEQLDRHTTARRRLGRAERFYYDFFMNVRYYININPFDREAVPRLNKDLADMELTLERVLQYLEMWGGLVETIDRHGTVQDGVLHFFMTVPVHEDTAPNVVETVEGLNIGVTIKK